MNTFKCMWCEEIKDLKYKHTCKRCEEEISLGFLNPLKESVCIECDNKPFKELIKEKK